MSKEKEMKYGVCSICGCTDNDPCWNPTAGYCWWTDDSHTLCSHCAEQAIKDDPKTIHCINSLKQTIEKHVKWLQGSNLAKSVIPLDSNTGIGYEFTKSGLRLKTTFEPDPKYNKRVIRFRISSYRGISSDAIHFYCTAESYVEYEILDRPGSSTSLFNFPEGFPEESKNMKFELVRPVTEQEIKKDPERWWNYKPGDKVIAFESKEEILEIIEQLKPAFGEDWEMEIIS